MKRVKTILQAPRLLLSSLLLLLFSSLLLVQRADGAATVADYLRLREAVFDPYVAVMPLCGNGPMTVNISLAVYMIVDVDEVDETFELSGWYIMNWYDCALTWNPKSYAGITQSYFPLIDELWLPDITWFQRIPEVSAFEFEDGIFTGSRANVQNTGLITVNRQILMNSYCPLSLQLFPFDTQFCNVTFTSWNYGTDSMIIVASQQYGDLSSYKETGMWKVQLIPLLCYNKSYASGAYTELTFTIVMQRQPLFYVFYLMLPGFLMSFLGSFVYLLPPESQQKNAFSLSILVSLTVFMNIMVSNTPPKSEIPLLSIYFFVVLVMSTCSAAAGVMIEAIYETNTTKPVPTVLRKIFLTGLGHWKFFRALKHPSNDYSQHSNAYPEYASQDFVDGMHSGLHNDLFEDRDRQAAAQFHNHTQVPMQPPASNESLGISYIYGADANNQTDSAASSTTESSSNHLLGDPRSDWWQIGYALDRLLFILHLVLCIIVVIGFFVWGLVYYYLISPSEFDLYND